MTISIKVQVLSVKPLEERSFNGRKWFQRQFHCFIEDGVAIHTLNAPAGDTDEAIKARADLAELRAGYYMADLEVQAGDRGRMDFRIAKFQPVQPAPQPKQTASA